MTTRLLGMLVSAAYAVSTASVAHGQTGAAPSVLDGAYSEEQAIGGQALYYAHCLACHSEDMSGLDQAPPLAGPEFGSIWDGEPLWALAERIRTMPPDNPDVLSQDEIVDLLAYVLWFNGLPIGEVALSAQRSVLKGMVFEVLTPSAR